MPIAIPEIYSEMIDRAKTGGFAFPAVNVTSSARLHRQDLLSMSDDFRKNLMGPKPTLRPHGSAVPT